MISYNELKSGKIIVLDNDPCEIVWVSGIVKKQRQKPHNSAKLRNLVSGNTIEKTFTQADKIIEADIETDEIKYLYSNRGENWFCLADNPRERFTLSDTVLEGKLDYLSDNDIVPAAFYEDAVISIRLQAKMDIKVAEAPPNIKGNTASGGNKQVVLTTGLVVTTPLFIETGDTIRVNTTTGEYAERVQK